jgi:nucleotide-binding universal stress UspA family protein
MSTTFRKILVPIDFSDGSDAAIPYAFALANPFGAEVTLFHAYIVPATTFPDGTVLAAWPESAARIIGAVEEKLTAARRAFAAPDRVRVVSCASEGPAADEILRMAREGGFDLVVMGTHGRTGLKRALLGSVAENVVRRAPCPVLTVRQPTEASAVATPPLP